MISLFPSGEPLRVSISAEWVGSRTGALLGFASVTNGADTALAGIIVGENGVVMLVPVADFSVDWRYDPKTDRWLDLNAQQVPESAQDL